MKDIQENIISNKQLSLGEFLEARDYLRETRLYKEHKSFSNDKDYVLTCASIEKMMPSIPTKEIPKMFNELYYYKGLTWIQQRYVINSLASTETEGDLKIFNSTQEPRIYCTFHIGSYRMSLFKLLEQGINLAMVLAKNTLEEQHESLAEAHEVIKKEYGLNNTLSFIDGESSSGAIQMVRALKEGKSLFFYIDGNTGVGGSNRNDDKLLSINFLDASIFARKGVAYIAHKCNVPIIVNLCHYISDDKMKITYYSPILADAAQDINESSAITTQYIYDIFSEALHKYPAQWEGWLSIVNYIDKEKFLEQHKGDITVSHTGKYVFNEARYSYFIYKGTICLLDKKTFHVYPIQQELLDILKSNDRFTISRNIIPKQTFEFLVKNKILSM